MQAMLCPNRHQPAMLGSEMQKKGKPSRPVSPPKGAGKAPPSRPVSPPKGAGKAPPSRPVSPPKVTIPAGCNGVKCHSTSQCVDNKCKCFFGYSGKDCSKVVMKDERWTWGPPSACRNGKQIRKAEKVDMYHSLGWPFPMPADQTVKCDAATCTNFTCKGKDYPPYLVIYADINETCIAGDGAKGWNGGQALQLVASRNLMMPKKGENEKPKSFYDTVWDLYPDLKERQHCDKKVLDILSGDDTDVPEEISSKVETINTNAKGYNEGCVSVALNDGRSLLVFQTFIDMLKKIDADPDVKRCLVFFRTYGPDMGDLVEALSSEAVGIIKDQKKQWCGYGEFSFNCNIVVNNHENSNLSVFDTLKGKKGTVPKELCKASIIFNPNFDPSKQNISKEFYNNKDNKTHNPAKFREVISNMLQYDTTKPKLLFGGLRDVFAVWQRFNRHHGKPLYIKDKPTGNSATDPIEVFFDDNAYEENKPGLYIITVFKENPNGEWVEQPNIGEYPEIVHPKAEKAFNDRNYYPNLLKNACNIIVNKS